jgi:hypothetical protein
VETDLELTRKLQESTRRELDEARKQSAPVPRPRGTVQLQPLPPPLGDFDDDPITAVSSIPSLAALLKQTAPGPPPIKSPPPTKSPPPVVPAASPEEVYELDVPNDEAEEIILLDEEPGENDTNGKGKK